MEADVEQSQQVKPHRRWARLGCRQGGVGMRPRQECTRSMTDVGLVDVHVAVSAGHEDDCPIYQH